jgi:glycosyltransferase involved in cell wall biosynthesis
MPHISVTVPVYNRAHLVGRTIESILQQQFQDFDVIVVDDASKDNTVEVVEQYCKRDPRMRLEVNPQNLGLTRNWNRCLELAIGPLVQIMQSDDLIDADYLQKVSDVFDAHPSIGFVASSCRYIDVDDRVIQPGTPIPPKLYAAGDEAVIAFLTEFGPHVSSIDMRRACYEEVGKFNEAIWHGPDLEMDVRLAARYSCYHFGAIHTSFRRHGSNMGNLEYLRKDFLEVDRMKKRKTWGYLSPEGQRKLGVNDLDRYLAHDAAATALNGAIVTLAYGRSRLTRYYLRQAVKFDGRMWRNRRWWMAVGLALVPPLGKRVMERRMRLSSTDQVIANVTETALKAMGQA